MFRERVVVATLWDLIEENFDRHQITRLQGSAHFIDAHTVEVLRFKQEPRSGLLFDLDTGRVLWRRDPTRVLPIASLTKMMTALVVTDRVPKGAKVNRGR
jgi:D-alanyl-D-alanine carboxypeptidase